MKVMGNRVLVRRLDEGPLTSKIIEVVNLDKEPGFFAGVVSVGQGTRTRSGEFIPIDCRPGDIVVLKKYSGAPVTVNGEDLHIVDAEDVLAVVER